MLSKSFNHGILKRSSFALQFRCFSTKNGICLQTEYPELYNMVHPSRQMECQEQTMDITSMISWKCPNGEDHEWEMSIREAIHLFGRNKRHSGS